MPKRKKGNPPLWSVPRVQDPRYAGWTVRVSELRSGGTLYACFRQGGRPKMRSLKLRRKDLGSTAKEQKARARAIALDIIEALATTTSSTDSGGDDESAEAPETLTLGALVALYEMNGFHSVGASYAAVQVKKVRRFSTFLGADRPVVSLCNTDVKRFAAHRALDGVGLNTIAGDLNGLKIALHFAMDYRRLDGSPLLAANPLQRVRLPREEPKRPWATVERYEALRAVADRMPGAFSCVLDLAWATGHRISAVLALRWRDVSFETLKYAPNGAIRWYAGAVADKKKHDSIVPINEIARAALEQWREQCPGVGAAWLFTAPTDPSRALGQHMVVRWLKQAEELAGLEHLERGGWHQFRRGFATARKAFPEADVAAAGGWGKNTETLRNCYLLADDETTLAAING